MANGVATAPASAQRQAPPFEKSTRLSVVKLASISRPTGGGLSPLVELPSNGLLAAIHLAIRGTVGGTVGTVNALGMASIVKRVSLTLNSGTVVWSLTGPEYHYLYRDTVDTGYIDVVGQTNARDAVTATGAVLDMVIPLQVNLRDPIGLLLLQNKQTTLTLTVEWEADATVTSTGTFSGFTATPYLLQYSVPTNPGSLPPLRYLHNVVSEQRVVSGAGEVVYDVPRANTYMAIIHGCGIAASGADSWSAAKLRVNQSNYLFDTDIVSQDMLFRRFRGRAREAGAIYFDFAATSGLGTFGTSRDFYDSNRTTDLQTVVTATGAVTFYTVRDQLIDLMRGA